MITPPPSILTLFLLTLLSPSLSAQQPHGGRLQDLVEFNVTEAEGIDPPKILPFGDVNGDSINELLVVRVYDSTGGVEEGGSVELISGATMLPLHRWYGQYEEAGFGDGIAVLADANGDGITDLAVGSDDVSISGLSENGLVQLYSGAAPYGLIQEWEGLSDFSGFGSEIADAGDRDGDGLSDLIIGAPLHDIQNNYYDVGAAFLYSSVQPQASGLLMYWEGDRENSRLGESLLCPGDLDGDGTDDFVIGAPGDEPPTWSWWLEGEAFVFSGVTGLLLQQFEGDSPGERFGATLASPGDFDGDGIPDLAIGAPLAGPFSDLYDVGSVTLYSGATGDDLYFWIGESKFSWFGFSLDAGDVDGDGNDDLIIGAPLLETEDINNRGGFYVFDGSSGEIMMRQYGDLPNSVLGAEVSFLGDRNGDGCGEFSASKFQWGLGLLPEGRGTLYSGKLDPQMSANGDTISNSSGGSVQFTIDFPDDASLYWFQLLYSAAGTGPVNIQGLPVPLGYDINLVNSYLGNYNPAFSNPSGLLNAAGDATSKLSIPAGGIPPSLINTTMYFAAISRAAWGDWEFSSVALPVTFLP